MEILGQNWAPACDSYDDQPSDERDELELLARLPFRVQELKACRSCWGVKGGSLSVVR